MSESMSSSWIRDYFMDIAETYGAHVFSAPVSSKKKRVQLTDLLTYQEDSYVWAWISDKDCRVSVRISKDAVDNYRSVYGRSVIDSRFFLVFVSNYRPMFSPRPLGPNSLGNTPVSHISLDIGQVSSIGVGGHLFGNPRDLESDENMKEWVSGLRQDGGGGNVLKLRKEQDLLQNKKASPSPPPRPLFQLPPAPQEQKLKAAKNVAKPIPEPQNFKRAYAKRWRKIEIDPWKFATKPAVEERPIQTEPSHSAEEQPVGAARQLESPRPSVCPTTPRRTPSPTSLQQQGTPTNWSPSNRGSPGAPDGTNMSSLGNGIRQHDEPEVLPITPHPSSKTEGHATTDNATTPDTCSLQPPTPAQRIKCSPICRSFSPSRSSPDPFTCSSSRPSQQLPRPSPLPPSSFPPFPSSSLPTPISSEYPRSRSSLHSLFSDSLEDGWAVSPHAPVHCVGRAEENVQEKESHGYATRHDPEAWKEPSFIAKNKEKGKARAIQEPNIADVKVSKKRRRSDECESPVRKQATAETMPPSLAFQSSKPRLANLAVDFERIDLQGIPIPKLEKDIRSILLRTGRIRTLGEEVEKDGSVYIVKS